MGKVVGRVLELNRYPVKSMAADPVEEVEIDWQGIEGDRQFAFYQQGDATRFPWLTARELPDLVRFTPRFRVPGDAKTSPVDVRDPEGGWHDLHDPAFLDRIAGAAGRALGLLQLGRGTHDAMPVSVVTTETHTLLDAAHKAPLDRRRFRSNIVIESDLPEREWAGRRLGFDGVESSAELLATNPIPRCAFVTIDPDSGARDPKIMRTVARKFDNLVGVYATASRQGHIRVGDEVRLLD